MASIKELKKKIKSTQGILKITSAMKLVAASKLNKTVQMANNARPFRQELNKTIQTIIALTENYIHPFIKENKENNTTALLVISSNRGLCGGYNGGLFKKVEEFRNNSEIKLFCVGKKGHEFFAREEMTPFNFSGNTPTLSEINKIGEELSTLFHNNEVGKVAVAYNRFYSALRFVPTIETLLPLPLENKETVEKELPFDFKYDGSKVDILDQFIPQIYTSLIFACMLDALASEHGARMSAMDNAVNNCEDAISELSLKKNKLRQSAITTELIEVVSGAESLN